MRCNKGKKGNRIINFRGFAISPSNKRRTYLRISENLLNMKKLTKGRFPRVIPIAIQDITFYENGLFYLNSIVQLQLI